MNILKRVLSLQSFSDNVRRLFLGELNHNLWTKDEIIDLFNKAHLGAHMQVLKDLEELPYMKDED